MNDDQLAQFYGRYLQRCNEHRFDELAEFVADRVEVNGAWMSAARYGAGLADAVTAVPDLHWDLRRLIVDGDWLAALLIDTGNARHGAAVHLHELAMYRVREGRSSRSGVTSMHPGSRHEHATTIDRGRGWRRARRHRAGRHRQTSLRIQPLCAHHRCRIEQMLDAVIAEMVGDPLADDIAVIAVTQTG